MKLTINARRTQIEDRLKLLIEKKLGKLDKFFRDDAQAKVTVTKENDRQDVIEVTLSSGGTIYRAEERTDDLYTAIDKIVSVIERQIRKNKTRLEKRLRDNAFDPSNFEPDTATEEETEFRIIRTKQLSLKPMSAEEAILQMNLLGHSFFLFKNDRTEQTNLVYIRNDGNYGLIEIE